MGGGLFVFGGGARRAGAGGLLRGERVFGRVGAGRGRRGSAADGGRVSINWGAWAEVGMAVDAIAKRGYLPCPFWLEASQKKTVSKDIAHPLLDQCVRETETEKAYLSDLSASRLWVLSEHKIMGNATLPGTAYLEMVRAAFEEHTQADAGRDQRDVLPVAAHGCGGQE